MNEATARMRINRLLEEAGWRFFARGRQAGERSGLRLTSRSRPVLVMVGDTRLDINGALREHVQMTARSVK